MKKSAQKKWMIVAAVVVALALVLFAVRWVIYSSGNTGGVRNAIVNTLPVSVAKVNGKRILLRDYERGVADMKYFFEQQEKYEFSLVDQGSDEHIGNIVMENAIELVLLEELAKEYGVDVTDADLETYYKDVIVSQEPRGEAALEEDLERYYGWTPKEFQQNELYSVVLSREIMEALKEDAAINEEPQKEAEELLQVIKNHPEKDFAAYTQQYSDDPATKESGGSLGFISRGQFDPAFEELAFSTPVGEVAGPVRTHLGFHLLMVTDTDEKQGTVEVSHILFQTTAVPDLLKNKRDVAKIKETVPKQ